ncbi:MAG: hypothetical protein IPM79_18625 [Polyangiaceae bacterium]|nr:hypothetical protein [Polyangiaceae bacterium]
MEHAHGDAQQVGERDPGDAIARGRQALAERRVHLLLGELAGHAGDPQLAGVPEDERQREQAGEALRRVHPVARVRVTARVVARLERELDAIQRVERERQEDQADLGQQAERRVALLLQGALEGRLALQRDRRRREVGDQEDPDRHDAA